MLLRLKNLPFDCDLHDIKALFQNRDIIQSIIIKSFNKTAMAWINLNETSRSVISHIAEGLDGCYIKGHKISAQAPSLYCES